MKFKSILPATIATAVVAIGFAACKYKVQDLQPAPTASFTVTPIAGATNKYLLTSTSSNAFRFDWDKGGVSQSSVYTTVDTAYFPDAGTYTINYERNNV
ncbi:MAG: hypothetical protein EOP50_10380, partial [Sphingobacteriales bacterium]